VAVVVMTLFCGAAIIIPTVVPQTYPPSHSECASNVDGIYTAEIGYDAAFDSFVAVTTPVPVELARIDGSLRTWPGGTAFDTLGWAPDGEVGGTYWVIVNGRHFEVHGVCDEDRDGLPEHYRATATEQTTNIGPDLKWGR